MFKAFFSETQRKLIKFLINTEIYFYFILSYFTGVLAGEQKSNCLSAGGGRPLHFGFCIHLLFLHTTAIDETALWISELPRFEHN